MSDSQEVVYVLAIGQTGGQFRVEASFDSPLPADPAELLKYMKVAAAFALRTVASQDPKGFEDSMDEMREMALDGRAAPKIDLPGDFE